MSRKEKQAAQLTGSCILAFIVFVVALWGVHAYKNYMKFSPSNEPGAAGSTSVRPAQYISTSELQTRLNKQYPEAKLVVDGKCGPETQRWWDRAYGDQTALELWPEGAK